VGESLLDLPTRGTGNRMPSERSYFGFKSSIKKRQLRGKTLSTFVKGKKRAWAGIETEAKKKKRNGGRKSKLQCTTGRIFYGVSGAGHWKKSRSKKPIAEIL